MKAIVQTQYGSPEVLQLVDVEKPEPADSEVLVKIHATTVTATEAVFRQGKPYFSRLFTGLSKPRIQTLGEELAGEVVAVGKDVTTFKIGDHVFGTAGPNFGANAEYLCVPEDEVITRMPSNLSYGEAAASVDGFLTALPFLRDKGNIQIAVGDAVFGAAKGAFAEYAIAAEKNLAHKPDNISFVDAAAIPTGGLTALQGLRDQGNITLGQRVLIIGASGGVGIYAVQIAKSFKAHVTAVCSTRNLDMVKRIGADVVIDYTQQGWRGTGPYDLILDMVGDCPLDVYVQNLTPEGRMVSVGALGSDIMEFMAKLQAHKASEKEARVFDYVAQFKTDDLTMLAQLMASGAVKSVIDRTFPLAETADAMAMQGNKRISGKVVIVIQNDEQ